MIDTEYTQYSSSEWIVDFETGLIGEPSAELAAVAQDIRFALSVERFMYPIMGNNFGVTFNDLIGEDYDFVRSEIIRRVKDALSIDDRVHSISEFAFEKSGTAISVSFIVETALGNFKAGTSILGR